MFASALSFGRRGRSALDRGTLRGIMKRHPAVNDFLNKMTPRRGRFQDKLSAAREPFDYREIFADRGPRMLSSRRYSDFRGNQWCSLDTLMFLRWELLLPLYRVFVIQDL